MSLCLSGNGNATFANLHADATPFNCTLTPLPAVSFPGLQ
jgi:hypothetical protein